MKELAIQIMNVCRGHTMHEALDALDFARKWIEAEAFVPVRGIKNPARDMTTGRIVESEPCEIEDKEKLKHELARERARANVLQELLNMNPLEIVLSTPEDSSACQSEQIPDSAV